MSQSISDIRKKRGRPTTGSTAVMVKLLPPQLAELDAWIGAQPDAPSRPEAIRRLLVKGLGN